MKKLVAFMPLMAVGCAFASLDDGLVAHYEFNGNAKDSSGLGNDGKSRGVEMVADRNGIEASACRFDGKASYIQVNPNEALDSIKEAVTVTAWIKPTAWDPNFYMPIVCKGHSTRFYGLMIYGTGNIWLKGKDLGSCFELCRLKPGVNVFARAYFKDEIALGHWQHVAITFGDGIVRAYLNGQLVGKEEANGPLLSGRSPLFIGSDPDGDVEYFNGDMDDVRIYNRRLSSVEVEDLYDGDLGWWRSSLRFIKRCFCSPDE